MQRGPLSTTALAIVIAAGVAILSCRERSVVTEPRAVLPISPQQATPGAPLATDAFDRANENPIAGTWTSGPGNFWDLQLVANGVQGVTAGVNAAAYYHAAAWPADQWSEVQLASLGPEKGGPAVRLSATAVTGYVFAINNGGTTYFIAKGVNGWTPILTSGAYAFKVGDVLRLEVQGTTLRASVNGTLVASVVDADIPSGHAGIWIYNHQGGLSFDNWAAGGFSPGPAPAPPAAPTNLAAAAVSASQIDLSWTDNATTESGFRIERCAGVGCSAFTEIATVGPNVVSYQNTELAASTSYSYRVRAHNADGTSTYSNTATAATSTTPPSAGPLAVDSFNRANENPISGSWTSGAGNFWDLQIFANGLQGVSAGVNAAAYYNAVVWPADQWSEVQLKSIGPEKGGPAVRLSASALTGYVFAINNSGSSWFIAKGVNGSTPILTSGTRGFAVGDVLRLEVQGTTLRASVNGTLVASVVDTDIPSGHAGIWIYNHQAGLAVDNWAGGGFDPGPAPAPPAAPTNLAATAVSASQIDLRWTDNATNESGFRIERCTGAGCSTFTEIATVGANVVSYQNTGLAASTAYTYRVRAFNADGTSAYSNTATATTAPSGSALRTQTDRPDEVSGNQIHVLYVLPSDGVDRALDTTGVLVNSVGSFQNWLAGQTTGRNLRLDTYDGGKLDISFWRLARSDETIRNYEGTRIRDTLEKDLVAAGFAAENKIYAVYYDGGSRFVCGGAAWPPQQPGRVAAIYLRGTFAGTLPCGSSSFASSPTAPPGYFEYAMLHEILHPMGIVSPGAPDQNRGAHVDTDPADLMYTGDQAWRPSVLDVNWSNYYNPGGLPAGLYNLATSPFLLPGPALVPPAAPANLAAAAVSTSRVDLNWTDNAADEAGFRIERCAGAGCSGFVEIATVGPNVVSYQNTGLAASTSYSYRVRAYIGGGASTYSNTATAATPAPPAAGLPASDAFDRANENPIGGNWTSGPGNFWDLQLVANGVQGVTAGVNAAAYYNAVAWPADQWSEVQLKSLGPERGGPAVRLSATAVTGYVFAIDAGATRHFIARGVNGSFTHLTSGAYAFKVGDVLRLEVQGTTLRASVNGTLVASVVDNAAVPSGHAGIWIYNHQAGLAVDNWAGGGFDPGPAPAPPTAPTNLVAAGVSPSRIDLSWTDNATNEDGFQIMRCTGAGCSPLTQIATVAPNVVSYQNTGLAPATSYSYRVRAYNGHGTSVYSNAATATTPAPPPQATVGQWSAVFPSPIVQLHLHLLRDGRVLSWGREAGGETPRVWDPATGAFTAVPAPAWLFCAGHDFLPDGRLLVAGGHIADGQGIPSTNLFDPATGSWQVGPAMAWGRWYPTNTTLPNGDVLTVAGTDQSGAVVPIPEVWNGSSWRQLTTASLPLEYYPRNFVAPDGRVFYAGEEQPSRWLDVTGTGRWSDGPRRQFNAWRNYGSAVMYEPGKILYVGGGDPPTNTAEIIDLNQAVPAWQFTGAMAFARRQLNATLLPTGEVLVTGGTSGPGLNDLSRPVFAAEIWNPATGAWTRLSSNAVVRAYHATTLLLPDGRVLHTGSGDGANAPNERNYEMFSPPYLFRGPRPTISGATPTEVGYGQSLVIETPDGGGISRVSFIRTGSVTHAFDQATRFVPLAFSVVSGGVSVTFPSSRAAAPPGPYTLFLVNGDGVPSVGRIMLLR